MKVLAKAVAAIVVGLAMLVGIVFVFSLPVYWLWNWLMPVIFNLPEITWTQALGLLLLSGFLFKSNNVSTKD